MGLAEEAERRRSLSLTLLDGERQADLSQFFTPLEAARILVSLPRLPKSGTLRVLDPGAGSGILTASLMERVAREAPRLDVIITAVELDESLHPSLRETLADCETRGATTEVVSGDFVQWGLTTPRRFDLVVQNPPYKKLPVGSESWELLQAAGISVPNIYAGFMAVGLRLLAPGGQQVSITPRSWANGTYFRDFRRDYVERAGIDAIHTFVSRGKVFGDTGVLQEAVIISATLGQHAESVRIQSSVDHQDDVAFRTVPTSEVITTDFVHIPATEKDAEAVGWVGRFLHSTLGELGLTVSTGRVVDFRSRDYLYTERPAGGWAMIFPAHFHGRTVVHPNPKVKKPQYLLADDITASKLLTPPGSFVLIKRFSAKEERRRVVASVWESDSPVGLDNKLNYIHQGGKGLDPLVARGLAVWLNSTRLDDYFRVFSGHTQVNATDLRQMPFPTLDQLRTLGEGDPQNQAEIDALVEAALTEAGERFDQAG